MLDGAYADFVEGFDGHAGLVEARDNVVMTRTFSKIHGLGGLRVGWGYGPAHVIEALNRVRGPFNLSTAALAAAEAAMLDTAYTAELPGGERAQPRRRWRRRWQRAGVPSDPSEANFVLARFRDEAEAVAGGSGAAGSPGSSCAGWRATSCRRRCASPSATPRPAPRVAEAVGGLHEGPGVIGYRHVALIGLGLIASSIAHAIRRSGAPVRITGFARTAATRAEAARLGLGEICESAGAAVEGADLVILCVPVGAMGAVAAEIAPHLAPGATVTDVGSVKGMVIATVGPHLPDGVRFIPGHPLAGTEHSGPASGFASLFDNRWCLLTPPPGADPGAVADADRLLDRARRPGRQMDPAHHDLVLAVTSHVPHLIAYTMVGVADHLRQVKEQEVINYSAAGFRDFTRIAASDPTMWRDVFLANKEATLDILGRFTEELFVLQRAIRMGDGAQLHAYFTRTRAIRRGIIEAGQDTAAPDFGRGVGVGREGLARSEARRRAEGDRAEARDAVGEVERHVEGVAVAREPGDEPEAGAERAGEGGVERAAGLGDGEHRPPSCGRGGRAALGEALGVDRELAAAAQVELAPGEGEVADRHPLAAPGCRSRAPAGPRAGRRRGWNRARSGRSRRAGRRRPGSSARSSGGRARLSALKARSWAKGVPSAAWRVARIALPMRGGPAGVAGERACSRSRRSRGRARAASWAGRSPSRAAGRWWRGPSRRGWRRPARRSGPR